MLIAWGLLQSGIPRAVAYLQGKDPIQKKVMIQGSNKGLSIVANLAY